ncbi:hypothetical protein BC939DRAFT_273320 [Gamsiella multidivaricata]|uniref:uncharacterized protein n=1 Tax=Gamsiella multidivaricata TaxID=101098 RepID=UPI00221FF28D|nr:uncharacterized protein BC939DRAFT_273320 [Gamsiella multidivaricata]KAI7818908.1 hypothetical protein BC939DRAFT_273320 [Gamsiella multidivaricata]
MAILFGLFDESSKGDTPRQSGRSHRLSPRERSQHEPHHPFLIQPPTSSQENETRTFCAPDVQQTLSQEVNSALNRIDKYFHRMEEAEEAPPIDRLGSPPLDTASANDWTRWIKEIGKRWSTACVAIQAQQAARLQTRIRENINILLSRWQLAPRQVLDSVLERTNGKVVLDRIQVTQDDHTQNLLEPQEIKEYVRDWFIKWHGPRPAQPLEPGSRWEQQYRPKEWIDEEWYSTLMDPPTYEEFEEALDEAPKYKAPGASGLSNDLFQKQGQVGKHILYHVPKDWRTGRIYCIPKAAEWSGSMADVRPITLLEHARKIMFTILTKRLSTILTQHNILRGPNYSVLKGTTTKDPIHALNCVMEDATEFKQEQWIVSRTCVAASTRSTAIRTACFIGQ